MRKLIVVLCALAVSMIGAVVVGTPAEALGPNVTVSAHSVLAFCHMDVTIQNVWSGGQTFEYAEIRNYNDAGCDYAGFRVNYTRCDGSTGTTAEIGQFNPQQSNTQTGWRNTANCDTAAINRIWFHFVATNAGWQPPSAGWIEYTWLHDGHYSYPPSEHCYPTAYCDGDRNDA